MEYLNERDINKDIGKAENYYAKTILSKDLWQLYAKVKAENAVFKSDIFDKNNEHFLKNIGNFDTEKIKHNFNMEGFRSLMKKILTR
jgi:hypothetical protein